MNNESLNNYCVRAVNCRGHIISERNFYGVKYEYILGVAHGLTFGLTDNTKAKNLPFCAIYEFDGNGRVKNTIEINSLPKHYFHPNFISGGWFILQCPGVAYSGKIQSGGIFDTFDEPIKYESKEAAEAALNELKNTLSGLNSLQLKVVEFKYTPGEMRALNVTF